MRPILKVLLMSDCHNKIKTSRCTYHVDMSFDVKDKSKNIDSM
jgi:hypothetical protein